MEFGYVGSCSGISVAPAGYGVIIKCISNSSLSMSASNIKLLENLINFCSVKNKVISRNIANVGTRNYKREDVEFKSLLIELNSSAKITNEKHIKTVPAENPFYEVSKDKENEMLSGINNVDIDKEMAELAENTLLFKFASRKIGDYYKGLQSVIKGESR